MPANVITAKLSHAIDVNTVSPGALYMKSIWCVPMSSRRITPTNTKRNRCGRGDRASTRNARVKRAKVEVNTTALPVSSAP